MQLTRVRIIAIICVVIALFVSLGVGLGVGLGLKSSAMSGSGAMSESQRSALRLATTKRLEAEANRKKRQVRKSVVDMPVETQTSPLSYGQHRVYETSAQYRYIIRDNSYCRTAKPIELKGATVSTTLDQALNMARGQEDSGIAGVYRDAKNMWRGCGLPMSNGDATWPATQNGQRIYEFETHLLNRKLRFNKFGYMEPDKNIRKMRPNIDGTNFLHDDLQDEIEKVKSSLQNVPGADEIPWMA